MRSSQGTREPNRDFLQRVAETAPNFVDLGLAYDERRAEGDDVAAERPDDEAVLLRRIGDQGGRAALRIERGFRRFVAHDLQRAQEPDAARFADEAVRGEALQPFLEMLRDAQLENRVADKQATLALAEQLLAEGIGGAE